jgi:hypothetical protein
MRLLILGNFGSGLSLELVTGSLARRVGTSAESSSKGSWGVCLANMFRSVSRSHAPAGFMLAGYSGDPLRNVEPPEFVALVRAELRPDAALSLGCEQILGGELLAARSSGELPHRSPPAYRGLRLSAWSPYRGEPVTGFSYT